MANQRNFVSNISELSVNNTKYTVSRIINAPQVNPLLDMEIPADFLDIEVGYTVEMHVYSLADNSLVYSDVIFNDTSNAAIEVQKYEYEDGSRNLLFIDFSKIGGLFLPVGKYRVVFNFFLNELNTSESSRGLVVSKISPSRREVELKYQRFNEKNEQALNKFTTLTIEKSDVMDAIEQIFNQSGSQNLQVNMLTSSIDQTRIAGALGPTASRNLTTYAFDLDGVASNNSDYNSNFGVYTIAQNVLNVAYTITSASILRAVTIHNSQSFTLEDLTGSVAYGISESYNRFNQSVINNQVKYRFELI